MSLSDERLSCVQVQPSRAERRFHSQMNDWGNFLQTFGTSRAGAAQNLRSKTGEITRSTAWYTRGDCTCTSAGAALNALIRSFKSGRTPLLLVLEILCHRIAGQINLRLANSTDFSEFICRFPGILIPVDHSAIDYSSNYSVY